MPASPTDPNPAPPRGALWAVLLLVALAPLVVHRQLISDDLFLYTYDAGQSHLARFQIMGEALSAGRLPLWQNIAYGGSPFLANPENPALYPPAMIAAALLPPLLAMNLISVLHLSLAAVGMALLVLTLARRCGLAPGAALAGALLAAMLFSLNWYTRLEHLNLVTYGAAHALIPWILLAVDRVLNGPRPRRAAGALALALAAQISTGGLYVVTYTGLALVLWVSVAGLCGNASQRRRALTWCLLAAGLAVVAGLSRLIPYRDWVAVTNRATSLDLDFALGRTLGGHKEFSWSAVANRMGNFSGGYAGFVLGLLMLPTLTLLRRRRALVGAWLLVLVGALVALGPGYEWLYRWVPPFDRVRNALRGWTLVNAAWPLLAGLGFAVSWQWFSSRWSAQRNESTAPDSAATAPPQSAARVTAFLTASDLDAELAEAGIARFALT